MHLKFLDAAGLRVHLVAQSVVSNEGCKRVIAQHIRPHQANQQLCGERVYVPCSEHDLVCIICCVPK